MAEIKPDVPETGGRRSHDASADAALAKMGYKSELPRNLSMLSVLGLYVFIPNLPVPHEDQKQLTSMRRNLDPSPSWLLPSVSAQHSTSPSQMVRLSQFSGAGYASRSFPSQSLPP